MADALRTGVGRFWGASVGPSFTGTALSSVNLAVGWVFMMPVADTITAIGYRQSSHAGTLPGTGVYKVMLSAPDASGLPQLGTDIGGGSPTLTTVTLAGANDVTWQWVTLGNSYTCTRGQLLAITFQATTGDGTNNPTITRYEGNGNLVGAGLPYALSYNGTTWTKDSGTQRVPIFGVQSSTSCYGSTGAFTSGTFTTKSTSTTGNRVAMKFTIPSGWCSTFKVLGARFVTTAPNSTVNYTFGLWDGSGTVQDTNASLASNSLMSQGGTSENLELYFADTNLATLTAGTVYYIGFECVSSNSVKLQTLDHTNASDLACWPLGTNAYYSAWNGATWSDTTTTRPYVELILGDITPPAGTGGIIIPIGMTGGVNG